MSEQSNLLKEVGTVCKKSLTYVFLFSMVVNILMLTVPIFMLLVFDYVLTSFSMNSLFYLGVIACLALGVFSALDILRGYVMRRMAFWYTDKLGIEALKLSADQLLAGNSYGTQSLSDLSNIRNFLTSPSIFALFDAPWMPLYLIIIFCLHPVLGWFATVGAILLLILGFLNEFLSKHLLMEANTNSIKNQQKITMVMRNIEVIQSMGMMNKIADSWQLNSDQINNLQQHANDRSGVMTSISKFLRLLLQLGVLATGAFLVINEQLTPGGMIAASILLSRALAPAEQSIGVWRQLTSVRQAYGRLKEHFCTTIDRGIGLKLPSPTGQLDLEHVSYSLPNLTRPIIDDISLSLSPGEILALVGPSGAGKSTLVRLIAGIINPSKGAITLDGGNVYRWDREDFGPYIGYVPQSIDLFPGTLKENIARMGVPDDEKIITASKLAGVHNIILSLPEAYDTEISITVNPFSGGQRQRVALARAYYGEPKLLILDEPNSNLDSEGEKYLYDALLELKRKGTTVIIITHNMSVLRLVDKIGLITAGKLSKFGPREQFLRNGNEENLPKGKEKLSSNVDLKEQSNDGKRPANK